MAKGKFEAGRKSGAKPTGRSDPYATRNKPAKKPETRKLWPILAAAAGVVVLVAGILIASGVSSRSTAKTTTVATVELHGMTRAEVEQQAEELDALLQRDLVLTLNPDTEEGTQTEEPIVITLPQSETGVGVDRTRLAADLDAGTGKESETTYLVDLRNYLTLNDETLRAIAQQVEEEYGTEYEEPSVMLEDLPEEEQPQGEDAPEVPDKQLTIRTGSIGRSIRADDLFQLLKTAYENTVVAEDPEAAMRPVLSYEIQFPKKKIDVEDLWSRYCKEVVEPALDKSTGEVSDGSDGYGFDKEALVEALEKAQPGEEVTVRLSTIPRTIDPDSLREHLFKDVLAEAHTPHTSISNRTNNLKLACAAINGTIVMPGEVFSFNRTVGERTEAKGYKEAIAYVGGASVPELGGGVCQVASSIYYAVLQADLKTVERAAHIYLVDYVPYGMDATIYWGSHDYKFENNSPYPIKIEASVHDGKVHIILYGTEWKDYTVKLSYDVLEKEDWKEVRKDVLKDGTYYEGEVISTPYTGYKVATYRTTYDKDGNKIETTKIATSRYSKRDKVIAHLVDHLPDPNNPTEPTQPTQPPTEPPTQPTQPPTQPTEPPTQPTEPPTEPPTQPPTEPPTEPPTQPPTEPPTEPPTQPPTEPPTEPPTDPPAPSETDPPEPSESESGD